ncbi:MAG: anaerobic sulfite reductase subunit AsrA [Treponemataceae bacterium]|nr:MAG: anaerobic sulfite reductase subunit AsrA [Treponemataceae bacterium]
MGFILSKDAFNRTLAALGAEHVIYAPVLYEKGANFSGLDLVRYGIVHAAEEIVFDKKPANSYKEALHAPSQTLFYFTESEVKEAKAGAKKTLVFLRSCDIHGLKRLDDIMLKNGEPDYFYARVRKNVRFALMPCKSAFENCFCVDMKTNQTDDYDFSVEKDGDDYKVNCNARDMAEIFAAAGAKDTGVSVPFVSETKTRVNVSPAIAAAPASALAALPLWEEYDGRCVNCGRCTFGCPSCSCWTMQDMFYTDNGKAGERRRVWASCMVDGYSDVAGGGSYRKKNGERMRFKVLHKISDHQKRFGHPMCTGCGRCDDVCPEYISFSNCVNKLSAALESSNKGGA